jgi:CheY-like chemotaxis protein
MSLNSLENGMKPESMTVLTIDDTPANIHLLTHYLEKEGYNVITAEDGFEGFKAAIKYHPDLILLDVMMPGTDGFEVCELLKADEETRDIPVVFLTAKADFEDRIKGFELGAVDYINKPFHLKEIAARVHTQLSRKYLQEQNQRLKGALIHGHLLIGQGVMSYQLITTIYKWIESCTNRIGKINEDSGVEGKLKQEIAAIWKDMAVVQDNVKRYSTLGEEFKGEERPVKINLVLENSIDIVQNLKDNIIISFISPDENVEIIGDAGRLEYAFTTLLKVLSLTAGSCVEIQIKEDIGELSENLKKRGSVKHDGSFIRIDMTCQDFPEEKDIHVQYDELFKELESGKIDLSLLAAVGAVKELGGIMDMSKKKGKGVTVSVYLPAGLSCDK